MYSVYVGRGDGVLAYLRSILTVLPLLQYCGLFFLHYCGILVKMEPVLVVHDFFFRLCINIFFRKGDN